jgi:precorrin-4/cobalt-precorrin-4 C11-methyltransferase
VENKVYFVGAGPGNVEYITLKGYRLLQQADLVVYTGSLINHKLLDFCKRDAKLISSAGMNLDEIISALEKSVKEDKKVVRLQTGDFSLYGSVREQIERLNERGVSYKLIPGVSSFLGAASEIQAEYTVPGISQSLIITRLEGRTPVPENEALEKLAAIGTSMAIFLSAAMIGKVCEKLLMGAYTAKTPVTVIYKATWDEQQIITGNIKDITQKVKKAGITKTALILVGDFLGKDYNYSKLYDKAFSHDFRNAGERQDSKKAFRD